MFRSFSSAAARSSARTLHSPLCCNTRSLLRGPSAIGSRTLSSLPNLPLFRALRDHEPSHTAVVHSVSGRSFTYNNLVGDVLQTKEHLTAKGNGIAGERVAFLAENGYDYVGTGSLARLFRLPSLTADLVDAIRYIEGMALANFPLSSDIVIYSRKQCDCPPAVTRIPSGRAEVYHGQLPGEDAGCYREIQE